MQYVLVTQSIHRASVGNYLGQLILELLNLCLLLSVGLKSINQPVSIRRLKV